MYYILNSYNKVSQGKDSVIKHIIRTRKFIYTVVFIKKKSMSEWTHAAQTHVVQESAALSSRAAVKPLPGEALESDSGAGSLSCSGIALDLESHISFPFIHLPSLLSVLTFPNPERKLPCLEMQILTQGKMSCAFARLPHAGRVIPVGSHRFSVRGPGPWGSGIWETDLKS